MKSVSGVLRDCRIDEVLCELVSGMPEKKKSAMLRHYYALYCKVLENWNPPETKDLILTGVRKAGQAGEEPRLCFVGVMADNDLKKRIERETDLQPHTVRIDWTTFVGLGGSVEVRIPDCVIEEVGDTECAALLLCQIERVCKTVLPHRDDRKLFDHVKAMSSGGAGRIRSAEKAVRHVLCCKVRKEYVIDEIREFFEEEGATYEWEDTLPHVGIADLPFGDGLLERSSLLGLCSGLPEQMMAAARRFMPGNPPGIMDAMHMADELTTAYANLELSDYQNVAEERKRIVFYPNASMQALPVIRVRKRDGSATPVSETDLAELMCMDIHVMDGVDISRNDVLPLIVFNIRYPIRIERMLKEGMLQSLTSCVGKVLTQEQSDFQYGFISYLKSRLQHSPL